MQVQIETVTIGTAGISPKFCDRAFSTDAPGEWVADFVIGQVLIKQRNSIFDSHHVNYAI